MKHKKKLCFVDYLKTVKEKKSLRHRFQLIRNDCHQLCAVAITTKSLTASVDKCYALDDAISTPSSSNSEQVTHTKPELPAIITTGPPNLPVSTYCLSVSQWTPWWITYTYVINCTCLEWLTIRVASLHIFGGFFKQTTTCDNYLFLTNSKLVRTKSSVLCFHRRSFFFTFDKTYAT